MKKDARLRKALALRPIEDMTVDAWADKYRWLSPAIASKPGKFLTSNVEVGRGPMRAVTEKGVTKITCKVATQLLKTTLIENTLAYFIHQRPCPVLLAFPKTDLARSFSKERLNGLIRATPVLKEIFGDSRQDKSEQSLFYKEFPGGFIALASAGSAADLAMRPVKITMADEVDKYEPLREEGSAVLLLEERTATFAPNHLHIRCSSPTWEETSQIEQSYRESDMRKPFIECPHCSQQFTPDFFRNVHWEKSKDDRQHYPSTAVFQCDSCNEIISELERIKILTTEGGVRWYQTRKFTCCDVEQDPQTTRAWEWDDDAQCGYALCAECGKRAVSNQHAGFTASKLLSPWPDAAIVTMAAKWIESKDDSLSKQVYYNTQLGIAFASHDGQKVEANVLLDRLERFPSALPKAVVRLTCGIDVQIDRLECHVIGWSEHLEAWSLYYHVINGNPSDLETWDQLDEFLSKFSLPSDWGGPMPIHASACDTGGHFTQYVYNFCQARQKRNVFAIKGASWSKRGDPIWPVPESRSLKSQSRRVRHIQAPTFKPVVVSVDTAKDMLREMLLKDEAGPGYFHIPLGRSPGWLDQMTAEYPIFERSGGVTTRKWFCPRNRNNEAWDTTVYALVALEGLRALRKLDLHKLATVSLPNYAATLGAPNG